MEVKVNDTFKQKKNKHKTKPTVNYWVSDCEQTK